jgi:hypothetical protein
MVVYKFGGFFYIIFVVSAQSTRLSLQSCVLAPLPPPHPQASLYPLVSRWGGGGRGANSHEKTCHSRYISMQKIYTQLYRRYEP